MICRGGSRIPRRRGRQPSRGAPTYDFAKFCEKLHEIEKILGRRGARTRAPPHPPLLCLSDVTRPIPKMSVVHRCLHYDSCDVLFLLVPLIIERSLKNNFRTYDHY